MVDTIITDLCVFTVGSAGGLTLSELHPGVTPTRSGPEPAVPFSLPGAMAWRLCSDLRADQERATCEDLEGFLQTP